jgi:MinD-like ATPase involved in chromosome partitioning or flagellar assembly
MDNKKTLMVVRGEDMATAEKTASRLAQIDGVRVITVPVDGVVFRVQQTLPDGVVVIEEQGSGYPGLQTCIRIRRAIEHPPAVFLWNNDEDPGAEYFQAALEAGVKVILSPADPLERLTRLFAEIKDETRGGRKPVLAIYSATGGSGKTLIAANLGAWVALQRHDLSVALVDLGQPLGQLAPMLGLQPERTVGDLVRVKDDLNRNVIERALTPKPLSRQTQLHLLAAASRLQNNPLPAGHVQDILAILSKRYVTFVDTSPALSKATVAALDAATTVLYICRADVLSVQQAIHSIPLLDQDLGIQRDKIRVFFNRVNPRGDLQWKDLKLIFAAQNIQTAGYAEDGGRALDPYIPRQRLAAQDSRPPQIIHSLHALAQHLGLLSLNGKVS